MNIETSNQLFKLIKSFLVCPSNILECFVSESFVRNEEYAETHKKEWVYYMRFWRGPFNECPIEIKYNYFRQLDEDEVISLICRELLTPNSPYFLNRKKKKIYKKIEVM